MNKAIFENYNFNTSLTLKIFLHNMFFKYAITFSMKCGKADSFSTLFIGLELFVE